MDISVSHAPSTYTLEIHAVQMSVRYTKDLCSGRVDWCISNSLLCADPTNLTIYFWALFWAPGALTLYFQISLLLLHIHIFPTFRPLFSLPSSRFPLHLHSRLVVIFLPSKVQTGVNNFWHVAHARPVFFTLPNLNHAYVTTVFNLHRHPYTFICFKMAECSLHAAGFHHRPITYTNLHGGTT